MSRRNHDPDSTVLLNRLLQVVYRSLPMYLSDAGSPWTRPGDERALAVLKHIADDQREAAQRVANWIMDRRGVVDNGDYPMEFTDTNFLALDYLLGEMIERQHETIAAIERLIPQFGGDLQGREIAQEVLGSERAHLDALVELRSQMAA